IPTRKEMKYERVLQTNAEVRVEAIDHESEGECYVTSFFGLRAMERAKEYADWKNRSPGDVCVKCQKALPPVATWSGPACPECTEAAEESSPEEPSGASEAEVEEQLRQDRMIYGNAFWTEVGGVKRRIDPTTLKIETRSGA